MKILVVEDSPSALAMIHEYLVALGHAVDAAANAKLATLLLAENSYDYCIFDYLMHDTTGFELLQSVRSKGLTCPVIILSAVDETILAEIARQIKANNLGPASVLAKPFDPDKLHTFLTEGVQP